MNNFSGKAETFRFCTIFHSFLAVIKKVEDWIGNGTFNYNRFNIDWIEKQKNFFDSFMDVGCQTVSPRATPGKRKVEVLVSSNFVPRNLTLQNVC